MDFSDLMDIANNKQQVAEEKIKCKKSKGSDSSQVSSEAIRAFLTKQNAEKAKQKEQEETAKRARIKARLQREQKEKSKGKGKTNAPIAEKDVGNRKQNPPPEKARHRPTPAASIQPSKKQAKPKAAENKRTYKEQKYVENKGREGRNKKDEVKSLDKQFNDKDKKKPALVKVKKAAADTLSFQELMKVAQKQINNPDAIRKLTGNPRVKKKETEKLESKVGREDRGKDEKLKSKAAVESPTSSKISKGSTGKRSSANGTKNIETNVADVCKRKLPEKTEKPEVKRSLPNKPQMTIERRTVSEKVNRRAALKRRYDDDDCDDVEMDDFIDDTEATPDISSYIKEIFGYDRNKFRDKEDDVDNMESSFADIQREEAKSSRIAKLEDEIERLKENYELQS